ncbi:hypothetical protein GCM10010129_45320 [Streptomyces fumigatiscleroticus]|nr:hypothetical protein GCM10010129_45320 [Streptomyces fumigatiscleroticus]
MFNVFEDLFAPGRKHTRDEQNRLELTREDVGDADPGRGPIDLASGRAVVRLPSPAGADRGGDRSASEASEALEALEAPEVPEAPEAPEGGDEADSADEPDTPR